MPPAVSIGLLTHNYGRYIRTALDSVLAQTFTDWELLVSDDCSTDDTAAIVAPYLADPRIRYVRHETNLRQGGNWAYAIDHGTADRIATLHADDWWMPNALKAAMAAFDAEPQADLICGRYDRVDVQGRTLPWLVTPVRSGERERIAGGRMAYIAEANNFNCLPSATLFTRSVVRLAGPPRTDLDMLVDFEFFIRLILVARSVVRLPQTSAVYRCHEGSVTATTARDGRLLNELRRLAAIAGSHSGASRQTTRAVLRNTAREIYSIGLNQIMSGAEISGRRLMREAAQQSPALLWSPKFMVDLFLAHAGAPGRALAGVLHSSRRPTEASPSPVHDEGATAC